MASTIRSMLEERARTAAQAVALCALDRAPLCFGDLAALVASTCERLRALGLRRGDRIALALSNGPEAATGFLCCAAGATAAPLNPAYRERELDFYLSDLSAAAVIVPVGELERDAPAVRAARARGIAVLELCVPDGAPAGVFELLGDPLARRDGGDDPAEPGPEDTALVLHTSGTTSRPKLVPLSQRNLAASAEHIRSTLRLEPADRCLNVMPLFHIHGLLGVLLSSLSAGSSVVATPGFDARRFFDWLEAFEPTWYSAVPTMHQAVLARAEEHASAIAASRLRLIRSSSAALAPSVLSALERTFGVPVIEAYGMTEAAHQMTSNPLPPAARKPGSVGPAAGPEVRVLDDDWRPLPPGAVGEVAIRGANVTAGYEANPEANRTAFRDGWFRTGDQGLLDADGYLVLTGRLKEIINQGGEKIAPREIDEVLLQHPAVEQAVAFALPDPSLGEVVGAAVVVRADQALERRELLAFAAARLADFKLPRALVFVEAIPKGPTGKLQRIGLAEKLGLGAAAAQAEPSERSAGSGASAPGRAPATRSEHLLAELFRRVLEVERVDAASEFFALGGDSLLAGQLIEGLRQATGVELPVYELFERPSLARLAAFVDAARSSDGPAPAHEPLPDAGDGPHELSFAQAGLWAQERLAGGTPINNRLGALSMRGPLDAALLEQALGAVFRRHEVLRARFPVQGRRPVQVVDAFRPPDLPLGDLRAASDEQRDALVAERARALAAQPFDLERGPLQRLELLALAPEQHVLVCVFHHIVFDGWSMSVLARELARCYEALARGAAAALPTPVTRYADHAAWQRARLAAGAFEEHLAYWRGVLDGCPGALELAGARPPGASRSASDGARRDVVLSSALHESLLALGRAEGTTLFMTLLAAFDALLQRWSGATDLVVGTLHSGRSHPASRDAIGLFANTLVLRVDAAGDPTFRELLARVRAATVGAYAHAEVPFEVLVRELRPPMVLGRNPYFDAVFQLRSLPEARAAAGALQLDELPVAPGFARFELLVEAFVEDGHLHTRFEARRERFDDELLERWSERWRSLLASVVARPDQRLSAIPLDGA